MKTPDQILKMALKREERARDFYTGLLQDCSVGFIKDLLEKLQGEESRHVHMVKTMLNRLKAGRTLL